MIYSKKTISGSSYQMNIGDHVLDVSHSSTAYTIDVLGYAWPDGYTFTVTDLTGNAGSLPITISMVGTSSTINGNSSYTLQEDHGAVTFTFNAFFNAWVRTAGTVVPTQVTYPLAGPFTDTFAPPPIRFIGFTTDGSTHTVSGITSYEIPGRVIVIGNINVGGASTVNLTNLDGSSVGVNQFLIPGGGTLALATGVIVQAVWDGSGGGGYWRVF